MLNLEKKVRRAIAIMIYIYMGCLLVMMSLVSFIMRHHKPNFLFGYQSYFLKKSDELEKKTQIVYRTLCLIIGIVQIGLGLLIRFLSWDQFFLIWLLTFYFSIILVYALTETYLRKNLVKNGIISKQDISKYEKTHATKNRVKGFKDL